MVLADTYVTLQAIVITEYYYYNILMFGSLLILLLGQPFKSPLVHVCCR